MAKPVTEQAKRIAELERQATSLKAEASSTAAALRRMEVRAHIAEARLLRKGLRPSTRATPAAPKPKKKPEAPRG